MAIEKTIKINVNTGNSEKQLKKVSSATEKVGNKAKETNSSLDKMAGGAISRFKGLINSLKGVALGFKSIGFAIAASGIGLLVVGIAAVTAAFKNSEAGQNKFAKIMGVIGSVTGNLIDILAGLGEKIIWAFENPKQAINDFVKLLKENIINRFEGLLELVPALGKAVGKLFKGDFAGAAETAANAVAKVALGTDNLTDSIKGASKALKDLAAEVAADAKKAAEIADQRAKADKIDRALIVERAVASKKIADLRFKAEQRDKFSAAERVEFLKEASKIQDDITASEIASARIRFNAQKEENKLAGSKKADLNKEAELQARLIDLDTQRLNSQKRLQTSITTFQREAQAERAAELKERQDEIKEFEKENDALELESLQIKEDAKTDIIKQGLDNRLAEIKRNAEKEAKALEDEQRIADEKEKIDDQITASKIRGLDIITQLAGKESALGKASLLAKQAIALKELLLDLGAIKSKATKTVAEASMDGAKAASSTSTGLAATLSLGFPAAIPALVGYAAAAVGIIGGVTSAVKGAKSVGAKYGGGGGAGGQTQAQTPSAPSFNLVQGTGSNQIAESLQTEQEPIKAFVVSSEVTTSQSLDRNIEANASI